MTRLCKHESEIEKNHFIYVHLKLVNVFMIMINLDHMETNKTLTI